MRTLSVGQKLNASFVKFPCFSQMLKRMVSRYFTVMGEGKNLDFIFASMLFISLAFFLLVLIRFFASHYNFKFHKTDSKFGKHRTNRVLDISSRKFNK
jgi:hypothetical protein